MDYIKEWTYNISLTLIIATILSLLAPKGNVGRFYKITVSMFILISFLIPFSDKTNLSFPEFEFYENDDGISDTYENLAEVNIQKALEEGGYNGCKTDCSIRMNGDEININKVGVEIPDRYDCEEVKSYLFENTGLVAEVYYIGE